jgi:hypothetical protein
MVRVMICGTRGADFEFIKFKALILSLKEHYPEGVELVEGCCDHSPDEWAEQLAKESNLKCNHFPGVSGNYLRRNVDMVNNSDIMYAFWDGYSYGTAQAIATAVMKGKKVFVIPIKKKPVPPHIDKKAFLDKLMNEDEQK